ncbi:MAG: hypothetical protein J6G98_05330 [Bacilli bacterium]|nr:hypothetical protein [Bacilli bacterium]
MEDKYSIKELITFIIIILVVLGIFYGITVLVTNKKNNTKSSDTSTSTEENTKIDYEKILAQNALSQKDENYFVYAYTNSDENVSTYNNDLVTYKNKEDALKVYYVELDNAFNKNNFASESNFEDGKVIFKATTLLKVNNGSIVEKYETKEEITNALTSLKGE